MAGDLNRAIDNARASWLINTTTADKRWALRQIHGLYNLLVDNRDEIVLKLRQKHSQPWCFVERQFALLVEDLAAKILHLEAKHSLASAASSGSGCVYFQPVGVSLIISNSDNPLRYALSPFAASVTARNVVVLGSNESQGLFSILQRESPKYLDTSALYFTTDITPDFSTDNVDGILIVDNEPTRWSTALASTKSTFLRVGGTYVVAIIDEGPLDIQQTVEKIMQSFGAFRQNPDSLSALFVQDHHFADVSGALSSTPTMPEKPGIIPQLEIPGCQRLTSNIYAATLSELLQKIPVEDFKRLLQGTVQKSALLLLKTSSIDQVIDVIRDLHDVKQIALLNPSSDKAQKYLEDWTISSSLSIGSISFSVPCVVDGSAAGHPKHEPSFGFPVSLFSRPRLRLTGKEPQLSTSVDAIRKSYENKIPKLKPDHPGGRVDFFVQVEYAVKMMATVLGVACLAGLWYGGKAIRSHFR